MVGCSYGKICWGVVVGVVGEGWCVFGSYVIFIGWFGWGCFVFSFGVFFVGEWGGLGK